MNPLQRAGRIAPCRTGPDRSTAEPLEFREATKRYPGAAKPAVDKLSLEVPAGEICVLVGPSGCGKTTAMRMVNRLIDITAGDILLGGRSVKDRKPGRAAPRDRLRDPADRPVPAPDDRREHRDRPELLGWDKERIARPRRRAARAHLAARTRCATATPRQLSGGQRQRVGVARALAADPPVLLMDEPFGAIDPINRERLQNEFLRLQAEIRKTIVFVTHDIDEAIKMGDRIAVLKEGGHLAQYAPPAELLMHPAAGSSRTSSAPTARSSASRSSACATSTCGRPRRSAPARRSPRRARRSPTPT